VANRPLRPVHASETSASGKGAAHNAGARCLIIPSETQHARRRRSQPSTQAATSFFTDSGTNATGFPCCCPWDLNSHMSVSSLCKLGTGTRNIENIIAERAIYKYDFKRKECRACDDHGAFRS
jgi:hypothetical protein